MSRALEVGVVYRDLVRRLWLVVGAGPLVLLSARRGAFVVRRPYSGAEERYEVVRGIEVGDLCAKWGVSAAALDARTREWLAPRPEGIKPAPMWSRRRAAEIDEVTREARTYRVTSA